MPKVSVVIPCYNVQKYICQCLDSLLAQTLTDFEIICVDDGSTDGTLDILNKYADDDSRIKVLEQKNQYAGVARNKGMSVATGQYIIFLDSDDFFDPRMLELTYNAGSENDADVVVFGFKRFDDKKQEFNAKEELPRKDLIPEGETFSAQDIPDDIFRITSPAPWTKLFKRSFVEATGLKFQPLPNSNDFFFVLSSLSLAEKICTVQQALAFYRVNMASSTQGRKHKNPICFLYAIEALYEQLQKSGLYDVLENAFQAIALSSSHYNLRSSSTDEARYAVLEALGDGKNPVYKFLGHEDEYYSNKASITYARTIYNAISQYNITKAVKQKAETVNVVPCRSQGDIKVSVVIPVYNTGDYLHETIDSICQQTLKEIEIICIDDGSTDNSLEIIKQWAEKDERVSAWTHENAGVSCTRNSGIQLARGKYIYFMDSDDILKSNTLEALYNKASEEELDVIYFDAEVFCDNPEFNEQAQRFSYRRSESYGEVYRGQDLFAVFYDKKEYSPSPCLQMLRSEYVKENKFGFHPGVIHEDNAFTFAAMINAERVSHINETFYRRRVRENSIMTTNVSFKNTYGYFVSYQDMVRIYSDVEHSLSEVNKSVAMARVAQNLANAQTNYANMSKEEIGREFGLGSDMRSFERLVVRPGNSYRQCAELKTRVETMQQQRKDLNEKNKKLNNDYKKLKVKYDKLNKKYKKVSKNSKANHKKRTRLQRFILCWWDHSFSYAVKLSFKRLYGKLRKKSK